MTERRARPRSKSTITIILDITFQQIRKTEAKYGPLAATDGHSYHYTPEETNGPTESTERNTTG